MSSAKAPQSTETYIIDSSGEPDVKLTLIDNTTGEIHHVVDFADELLREKLQSRGPGSVVRADVAPVDEGGEEWQVTRLRPGAPPSPGLGLGR
jgi:hypothetical protein